MAPMCPCAYTEFVKNVAYKPVFSCSGLLTEQESPPSESGSRSNQTHSNTWPDGSYCPSPGTDTPMPDRSKPLPDRWQQLHMAVLSHVPVNVNSHFIKAPSVCRGGVHMAKSCALLRDPEAEKAV